jgi:hypothetical protein
MFSLFLGNSSSNYFDYTTSSKIRGELMFPQTAFNKHLVALFVITIAVATGACAALQPIDTAGPRSNIPAYPINVSDAGARLEEASVAWNQMSQHYGLAEKTEANLNPYTGTLESLPPNAGPIVLPKVGTEPEQTEEQTRESLRRFIVEWKQLIGADPDELSLVERSDDASGVKTARYEQKPFRYPLRGGYGNFVVRFRPDRQVVSLSSNCIPNADRIQATLAGLTPKVTAEQAVDHVKSQQTPSLPANATVEAKQLVVYAQPSKEPSNGLEVRLAWEIEGTGSPVTRVYLDAISDEIIATS